MKVSLVVMNSGKHRGHTIAMAPLPFLIGRDPGCHLRPASASVAGKQCAFLVRDGRCFVRAYAEATGTLINNQPVQTVAEVHNGDALRVGPLSFAVRIENEVAVDAQTPAPQSRQAVDDSEDAVGDLLLSLPESPSSFESTARRGCSDDHLAGAAPRGAAG